MIPVSLGFDLKTRKSIQFCSKNFLLANNYKLVMMAYSFREVRPALNAASMKWMKWKAAARWSGLRLLFPTCVDVVFGEQ